MNDPGRGWSIDDGDQHIFVFLELPPYHACSTRRFVAQDPTDFLAYRHIADRFEATHPSFTPMKPFDNLRGGLQIHLLGEQRLLPGGGSEALFVIDQHAVSPEQRQVYETRINVRFVHQIASPGAK